VGSPSRSAASDAIGTACSRDRGTTCASPDRPATRWPPSRTLLDQESAVATTPLNPR